MSSFGENFENLENKILNVPSNIVDSMKRNNIANSIVLLLLLYVILAAPTMSPTVVKLFNNNFFKLVYIFLVMCLVSQNPILSLVVAVVLLVVLNKLLEPKPHVVIPEANVVNKPIVLQPGAVVTTTASGQTVVLPPSVMSQNNVEHFSFLGIGNDSAAMTLGGTQQTAGGISNLFGSGNASPGTVATSVAGNIAGVQQNSGGVFGKIFGTDKADSTRFILSVTDTVMYNPNNKDTFILDHNITYSDGSVQNQRNLIKYSPEVAKMLDKSPQKMLVNKIESNDSNGIIISDTGYTLDENKTSFSNKINTNKGAAFLNSWDAYVQQSASGNLSGATSMGQGISGIAQSASGNLSGATSIGQGISGIAQSASGNLSGATSIGQGISGITQSASGNLSGATSMGQGISGIAQSASGNLSGATSISGVSQSASGNLSGATSISGVSQSASGNLSGATSMGQGSRGVSQNPTAGPSTNIDGERLLRENVKLTSTESSNLYNSLAKFYSDPKIKKSDELRMAEKLKQKYFPSVNFSNAVLGQKKDEVEMSCKLVCDNKKVEKFENEESNDRLTQRQQMMNLWQANQSKDPAVLPGFVTMEQQTDSCAAAAVNSSCDVLGVNKYHSTSHARVTIDNNPCPEDGEVHGIYENVDKEYADYTN